MDAPTLATTFDAVEALYERCDTAAEPSNEEIQEGIASCGACARAIRELGVLSANEFVEDMLTEDLRYLLVEYYRGAFTQKLRTVADRFLQVSDAKVALEGFLRQCEEKMLVGPADLAVLGLDDEGEEGGSRSRAHRGPPPDIRTLKIEHFKANTRAKKRLAELRGLGIDAADEGVRRERTLLLIDCCVRQAVDDVLEIKKELPLLEHRSKLLAEATAEALALRPGGGAGVSTEEAAAMGAELVRQRADEARTRDYERVTDPSRPGLDVTVISPGLVSHKEVVKAGIFRPDHRLPTMSLEEFAEMEVADALARAQRQTEGESVRPVSYSTLVEEGREDDAAAVAAATLKDRNWDDWKDDNPKGIGNTKRY